MNGMDKFLVSKVKRWIIATKRHKNHKQKKTPSLSYVFVPFVLLVPLCDYGRFYPRMKAKILSIEEMLAERARLRSQGARLVFTNGVFDLLHVGHVRYLAQARTLGDALVVAINSDRSVRELKGPERPVFTQAERAEILAALRQVDYVVVFDEATPRSLISQLLPDVLVKGGDYQLDQIHGREEVEAAGGIVMALPFVDGASTTRLIERMKKKQ